MVHGHKIKVLLVQNKITQHHLAAAARCHPTYISKALTGILPMPVKFRTRIQNKYPYIKAALWGRPPTPKSKKGK